MLPPVPSGWGRRIDRNTDFSGPEPLASLKHYCGHDVNQGSIPMTFVSRLSVVTAYIAFAFVGAIVLGVF
jgi:hypothetical protein